MIDIRLSLLWRSAFDIREEMHPAQVDAVRRLLAAYNALEERIAPMLALIPRDCEGLTIHDISHVHQLWHVSDQICGPYFKMNPLEGFVLAAAFLIHDAGLTAATYPGGLPAIEGSQLYQDIIAYKTKAAQNSPPGLTPPNAIDRAKREALFETLRLIHADRAAHVMEMEFRHPLVDKNYNLLADLDLLLDCGEIIGRIAASHHWPI